MTEKETIKKLRSQLKDAQSEVKHWSDMFYETNEKHRKYRGWIKEKFDWWVELLANDRRPCLKFLIKDTAKILGMWS